MRAKAILFTDPGMVRLGETEIPAPGRGEVLIRTEYTCISPGTELRCLAGRQQGAPGWPFIPGYALSGVVVEAGLDTKVPEGTRVLCAGTAQSSVHRLWGGHVEYAIQPELAVFPVPESLGLLDASLARLAAIAYRGVRHSRPMPDESVAVIGLGAIGQLSARLHALSGARVVAADRSHRRVAIARDAGIEAIVPEGDLETELRAVLPEGADIVVETTGVSSVIPAAIGVVRAQHAIPTIPGNRLLVQATYPGEFTIPYMPAFQKELTILMPRDRQPQDMWAALKLMARGQLRTAGLISEVHPPEEAPEIYAELGNPEGRLVTAAFRWR